MAALAHGRAVALLLCILLASAACSQAAAPPTGAQPATISLAEATRLATSTMDLMIDIDGDGVADEIALRQAEGRLELSVVVRGLAHVWRSSLPAGWEVDSIWTQDLTADSLPEILVAVHAPVRPSFGLFIVRWTNGKGQVLQPLVGAVPAGPLFVSEEHPVWIADLDGDTMFEVVLCEPDADARFLRQVVFAWNGHAFSKTEMFLLPPRTIPSPPPD